MVEGQDRRSVAARIEATVLRPETTAADVRDVCAAALLHDVRGVCVLLEHVEVAVGEVAGSGLEVITVAGFPTGEDTTRAKVRQIGEAADAGADEVDVVLAYRQMLAGDTDGVSRDVEAVVATAHDRSLGVKVILETGALTPELVDEACAICVAAGADWVKTSTGLGPRGATVDDIVRLRRAVGGRARVKAAGGVRTWEDAVTLIDAGADAVGCSSFVEVLEGAPR
jgi:deoxyribose-phosphate aldolase